jgi:anti-sigma factor (TIGR02949 family)
MNDPSHNANLTCEQAFSRLYEFLDRVLTSEDEALVRQHLAVCEGCVRHFHFEEQLLAAIRDKCRTGRVPDDLKRQIEQLIDKL